MMMQWRGISYTQLDGTSITSRHVESALILLEQGFVRVFQGSPQKGFMDFLDPNEWHRSRDAVGFNKIALGRGEWASAEIC